YPLQGAEFTIYHNGKELRKVTSGVDGIVDTGDLIIGKYEIVETKAPNGYYWNRQYKEKFEIVEEGQIIKLNYNQPLINELMRGGITLNKQGESLENDNDAIVDLEGTEFSLYKINNGKEKFVDKLTTDKFGYAQKEALKPGDYVLRETKPTEGYLGDFEEFFTIEHNYQIITMNHGDEIQNQVIKGQAELFKIGESLELETKDYVALEGVKFIAKDSKGKVVDTLTTDSNGYIITRELKYGTYTIEEVETIDGYVLGGYKEEFKITTNGEIIELADFGVLENKAIKGKAELFKIGEKYVDEEFVALEGVEFEVYKDVNADNLIDTNDKLVDTLITDVDGYAITRDLKVGQYLVKESKTLTGLVISDEVYPFEIKEDGIIVQINKGNSIENRAIRGSAVLYKEGESFLNWQNDLFPLQGAEFTLYNHKMHDLEIGKYYSDNEGEVLIENLPYGIYKLVETNPANGYMLNGYEEVFEIVEDGVLVELNDKVRLENPIIKGKLELNKVNDSGEVLAGVEFEIKDSNGIVVDTLTTDENGYAISRDLKYGSYTLQETKTVDGHIIDNTIYNFEIIEEGAIVQINEGNAIINIKKKLESTGFKTSIFVIAFSIVLLVILVIIRKKSLK
ncbi:MAG: SpaA isopeptide-forming pilin-related protein, partial [Mycoplasmatales bacterium]